MPDWGIVSSANHWQTRRKSLTKPAVSLNLDTSMQV